MCSEGNHHSAPRHKSELQLRLLQLRLALWPQHAEEVPSRQLISVLPVRTALSHRISMHFRRSGLQLPLLRVKLLIGLQDVSHTDQALPVRAQSPTGPCHLICFLQGFALCFTLRCFTFADRFDHSNARPAIKAAVIQLSMTLSYAILGPAEVLLEGTLAQLGCDARPPARTCLRLMHETRDDVRRLRTAQTLGQGSWLYPRHASSSGPPGSTCVQVCNSETDKSTLMPSLCNEPRFTL